MKQSKQVTTKKEPKVAEVEFNPFDFYQSKIALDEELIQELKGKDLKYRWINLKDFQKSGTNRASWRPYKRESKSATAALLGSGHPEGYEIRGDLVLAVKTQDEFRKHKAFLAFRANKNKNYNRQAAEDLKKNLRDNGIDSKVVEGYEDGQSDEE